VYPYTKRLGDPQNDLNGFEEEKVLSLAGSEPRLLMA
jgi:hypothetical protein